MPKGWSYENRYEHLFKDPPPMSLMEAAEVVLGECEMETCRYCWHLNYQASRSCNGCSGTRVMKSLRYRQAERVLGIGDG